jgi:hypothetical protein
MRILRITSCSVSVRHDGRVSARFLNIQSPNPGVHRNKYLANLVRTWSGSNYNITAVNTAGRMVHEITYRNHKAL